MASGQSVAFVCFSLVCRPFVLLKKTVRTLYGNL